ncbi:AcrR family transcriptional regulator [Kitasatospora sp. MAA4]|uniref:TetR/AcrR family transcriptional regulator n=1 Tax=Kitasatospora sp. MAA4 TaxID=3035093 RepID=UPI0024737C63|nr:TetR/AcrR family transcriptional regulator [Kitasatospora sp. MAA4]MDH6135875.1 AcrR family transcriptional regulator [Kitasatospora sp. MAA4]
MAALEAPRREQLLNAADRVVRRDGPGASMNAIAAEAGITKPILYRHFGDRNGLFQALTERHTSGLLDAMRAALAEPLERRERVELVLDTYLAGIESRPQVYQLLTHPEAGDPNGVGSALAPAMRQIADEITRAVTAQVDLGPDAPLLSETWGRAITGMVLAAGDWWLEQRPCPRARMVQALADLLWGRLAAAAPLPAAPLPSAPPPTPPTP